MKQKGQRFDTQALTQEAQALTRDVVSAPFRLRTYRLIRKILIGFILVSIANVLFSYFFYTPKMYRIIRDNRDLVIKYRILQDRIRTSQRRVDEIRHRDNYVYRSLFSTDTVSIDGVWQPYPDTKYAPMAGDDFAPLMVGTWKQLDALARITSEAAKIAGIAKGGHLSVGARADICIFDPDTHQLITRSMLKSQGKNTPFIGYEMAGRVSATLVGGRLVFARQG